MPLVPALVPLRLVFDRSANLGHPRREPLAYAYVLVDLTGTPTDEVAYVQAAVGEGASSARRDRPSRSGLRVSDEVTWRLALRTDRNGYLKDPFRLPAQPDDADTDSAEYRDLLDRAPPLPVMPGLELNLWWCRDRVCYEAALLGEERRRGQERIAPVTRERQLLKVSTKLRRSIDVDVVAGLAARYSPEWTRERVEQAVSVEDPASYRRATPVFEVDERRRVTGLMLELEDVALTYALHLAGRILDISRFPAQNELPLVQAYMDRLHQVLERYERGEREWTDRFNTILEDASRRDREYSAVRFNLGQLPRDLRLTSRELGAALDRLSEQAIAEAQWHHPRRRAAQSVTLIARALACFMGPELWSQVISAPELDERAARVLRGEREEASTPLLRALGACVKVVQWTGKSASLARQASEWIEVGLSEVLGRHEREVERILRRASDLLTYFEDTGGVAWDASSIGQDESVRLILALDDSTTLRRDLDRWVVRARGTSRFLQRLGRCVAVVNAAVAFYEACDDRTFRNWADAAQNAGEVIDKIDRLKAYVCEHCHLDAELFGEVVGAWGVAISFVDAVEAGAQGNRVAMVGHVLGGAGGVVELMATRGSPAGFLAALLIVSGAVVVAISLSDDAAWVLEHFDDITEGHRSRAQDARSVVRRADELMAGVRRVLRSAERETAAPAR